MAAKKNKKQNNFKSVVVIIVALAIVYLGFLFVSQQVKINSNGKVIKQLETQLADEEKRRLELEAKLEEIDTPEYIEKVARDDLGMVAPDEIVFMEAPKNQ